MAVMHVKFYSESLQQPVDLAVMVPSFDQNKAITEEDYVRFYNKNEPLPEGYHRGNRKKFYAQDFKYQTLYLLPGGLGGYDFFLYETSVARYAADNQIAIVMVDGYNGHNCNFPDGPDYWSFITEEVPEFCESMFPLSRKREDRFIGGFSMGARGAMNAAAYLPERYQAALMMGGQAPNYEELLPLLHHENMPSKEACYGPMENFRGSVMDAWYWAKVNAENGKEKCQYYFMHGSKDLRGEIRINNVMPYLKDLGYEVFYDVIPGEAHTAAAVDKELKLALYERLPIRRAPIKE